MMRSLFSGVAGLKTHQTRMDVIGNNIANVNTTAYKSQSMTFSDLMYQTTQAASGANATTGVGGINARQIGLGSKTSAIKTAITQQGSAQNTNDPFDIMISGDAFFIVNNGNGNYFTRDGSFYVDGAGNLAMTSTGYIVQGWQVDTDPANPNAIKKETVSPLKLMTLENMTYPAEYTTAARVSGIVDRNDTDVSTDAGRTMNLEFFDNQGYKYTAKLSIHKDDDGNFTVQLDRILDSKGNLVEEPTATFGGAAVGTGVPLLFNPENGAFAGVGVTTADPNAKTLLLEFANGGTGTAFPASIEIDFSTVSNLNNNGSSTVTALRGNSDGNYGGRKVGALNGFDIQKDGLIYATYDNGQSKLLGQIAVATFANPSGLAKEGDNLYSSTQNSGEFDGIGQDITDDGGYMNTGVLEMSNVDLSAEFVEMITTQRGFQANSRIITVSDTLLEELINLKR